MKKQFTAILLILAMMLGLCSCSGAKKESTFWIQFIDVGQGDSALIECDGEYMLIDGGDEAASDIVSNVLKKYNVNKLSILALSHMHADHIAGLPKALKNVLKIGITISNKERSDKKAFKDLEPLLINCGCNKVKVPREGEILKLGSADIEVIDATSETDNDSLVLMITYGDTKFLFTGDIEDEAQTRIADKYQNENDKETKIDLIKMPHHGSASPRSVNGTGSLYRFLRTFMPDYAVISVGKGNSYGHPHKETLSLLDNADVNVYRTDQNGDIVVKSDGKTISVESAK